MNPTLDDHPGDDYPTALPAGERLTALPADEPLTALPVWLVPEALPATETALPADVRRGFWTLPGRLWRRTGSGLQWMFGAVTLVVGLAVLAALPVMQLLTLGYLLEGGGRIARTGRLRDGFIGVRTAARAGSIVLGTWLMLLPLRLLSSYWVSAQLIDPDGPVARNWRTGLTVATVFVVLHIVAACSRGGKLRYFFWPFNPIWLVRRLWRGGYYTEARDAVWDFVTSLRLPYYFWLGFRGFIGGMAWLVVPISLLAVGRYVPAVGILLATPLLVLVLLHLPFLQVQFAARNRFAAMFDVLSVWRHFGRAPWAFAFAFVLTLLFAVPLYLLKIEMIPREAAWLPGLVFITFIFPARLLTGWAYGRAERRPTRRHWFFWTTGPVAMLPVALLYVVIVFFSQYAAWGGIWSLYEQHAFLLPVPFVGM